MDFQNEDIKLEAPAVCYKNQCTTITRRKLRLLYLRRALALLLSASLLSILLSFFSELPILHSNTYYLSTFLLPLFTQIFERKCMFLLCNGILVFLAGKSGLCSASGLQQEAEADGMRENFINADQEIILQSLAVIEPVCEVETRTVNEAIASVTYTIPQVILTTEQQNKLLKLEQEALDGEKEATTDEVVFAAKYQAGMAERSDQAPEVEIEDEDRGLMVSGETDAHTEGHSSNTEELNKKIEDFIRKMKEELRLETQQQPPLIAA